MYKIKKKLIFKNQVYKVFSNHIKSKTIDIKNYLSLEVKGKNYGGVCCILVYKDMIGLMKVFSPIVKKYFYSLPQGFTNFNEDIKTAIKREVLEETGIKINAKHMVKICEFYPMQSLIKSKLAVFYSKLSIKPPFSGSQILDEIGVGKLFFFKIDNLKKMLRKSNKFDLITFCSLSYFIK